MSTLIVDLDDVPPPAGTSAPECREVYPHGPHRWVCTLPKGHDPHRHVSHGTEEATVWSDLPALSDCVNWSSNERGDCGGRLMIQAGGRVLCENCANRA